MSATYTFTGQCYSQSGDVKKYEENLFTASDKAYATDTILSNNFNNSCFYFSGDDTSYINEKSGYYAYYTYTVNINENTGDYDYKFIAYAFNIYPISKLVTGYAYCAILNGDPQHPEWLSTYSYKYKLGTSYNAYFLTEYGGVQKYAYLKFQIATYWNVKITNTTYYSTAFSFLINSEVSTTREFVGIALFSIDTIGEFVGTESEWAALSVPMILHVNQKSSNLYTGYVSCSATNLYTAKLTVADIKISLVPTSGTISTKSVYVAINNIYVFGISKVLDSTVSGIKRYRYSGSLLETLTESSWSTTKPSI